MKPADRYFRYVRWSEEDQLFLGYCPDLIGSVVCHGKSHADAYSRMCDIIDSFVANAQAAGETLPEPSFDPHVDPAERLKAMARRARG